MSLTGMDKGLHDFRLLKMQEKNNNRAPILRGWNSVVIATVCAMPFMAVLSIWGIASWLHKPSLLNYVFDIAMFGNPFLLIFSGLGLISIIIALIQRPFLWPLLTFYAAAIIIGWIALYEFVANIGPM